MNQYQMMRRVAKTYAFVEDKTRRRHYQRQWIRAINILGDRYLLAVPVERKK